jgi:hypothetical protein
MRHMNAQVPYKLYITQEYHAHGYNLQEGTNVAMPREIEDYSWPSDKFDFDKRSTQEHRN